MNSLNRSFFKAKQIRAGSDLSTEQADTKIRSCRFDKSYYQDQHSYFSMNSDQDDEYKKEKVLELDI